jgi:hypothetical protein
MGWAIVIACIGEIFLVALISCSLDMAKSSLFTAAFGTDMIAEMVESFPIPNETTGPVSSRVTQRETLNTWKN